MFICVHQKYAFKVKVYNSLRNYMFEIYGFSRNLTLQYSLTKQWNTICVQHLGGLDISWTDKDFFFKRVWWQSSTNNFIVLDFLTRSCAEIFVFDYFKKKRELKHANITFLLVISSFCKQLQLRTSELRWLHLSTDHRTFLCKEREYWSWYSVGGSKEGDSCCESLMLISTNTVFDLSKTPQTAHSVTFLIISYSATLQLSSVWQSPRLQVVCTPEKLSLQQVTLHPSHFQCLGIMHLGQLWKKSTITRAN